MLLLGKTTRLDHKPCDHVGGFESATTLRISSISTPGHTLTDSTAKVERPAHTAMCLATASLRASRRSCVPMALYTQTVKLVHCPRLNPLDKKALDVRKLHLPRPSCEPLLRPPSCIGSCPGVQTKLRASLQQILTMQFAQKVPRIQRSGSHRQTRLMLCVALVIIHQKRRPIGFPNHRGGTNPCFPSRSIP